MPSFTNLCKRIVLENSEALRVTHIRSIRKIGKGACSVIYLATTDRGPFVVKIKYAGEDSLEREFHNLEEVRSLGVAPKPHVHGTLEGKHFLIEDFVPGKRLPWRGMTITQVRLAAAFFSRIHSVRHPPAEHKMLRTQYWEGTLRRAGRTLSAQESRRCQDCIDRVTRLILENRGLFEGERPVVRRFEDPNPHNLIATRRAGRARIIAVDWEWSKPGDYALDIADFFNKANLDADRRRLFFKHYKAPEQDVERRIALQRLERRLGLVTWHVDRLTGIIQGTVEGSYGTWHTRFLRVLRQLERGLEARE